MDKKSITIVIGLVGVSFLIGTLVFAMRSLDKIGKQKSDSYISSFDDCVEAGYPVMESYPRQCAVPGVDTFVEEIDNNSEIVNIANPASAYCTENGGKLEIRDGETGQSGYCIFEDGSECEEWEYFKGECSPKEQQSNKETK